jgi:hypothetical protein
MIRPARLTFVFIFGVIAAAGFAFDFGGYLDTTTGYATPPVGGEAIDGFIQQTTLAAWMNHDFGEWELDAQGSYTYTPLVPLLLDVDRLTLSTDAVASEAGATTAGLTLGRTRYVDFTGHVLDHTLDGLRLRIDRERSSFRFDLATSALVLTPRYRLVEIARTDIEPSAAEDGTDERARLVGPPGIVVGFDYSVLDALAGQEITLGARALEDLRPDSAFTPVGTELPDPNAAGRFDRQYVTLGLGGSIGPGLFQRSYYVASVGSRLEYVDDDTSPTGSSYQYRSGIGHMVGSEISWFLPEVMNSRARFFGLFSTGPSDPASWAGLFVPISATAYSDVFSLQPGNSAHLGLSYSVRPLAGAASEVLQTELRSVAYFRTGGGGAVSEPTVDPTTSGAYVGTDVNLVVTVLPFSDLRFVVRGGLFVPNAAVMSQGNDTVDYETTLQGVLRF